MRFLAAHGGNVRIVPGGSHGDSGGMGEENRPNHGWVITVIKNHEWTRMDTKIASPPGRQSAEGFV